MEGSQCSGLVYVYRFDIYGCKLDDSNQICNHVPARFIVTEKQKLSVVTSMSSIHKSHLVNPLCSESRN